MVSGSLARGTLILLGKELLGLLLQAFSTLDIQGPSQEFVDALTG